MSVPACAYIICINYIRQTCPGRFCIILFVFGRTMYALYIIMYNMISRVHLSHRTRLLLRRRRYTSKTRPNFKEYKIYNIIPIKTLPWCVLIIVAHRVIFVMAVRARAVYYQRVLCVYNILTKCVCMCAVQHMGPELIVALRTHQVVKMHFEFECVAMCITCKIMHLLFVFS